MKNTLLLSILLASLSFNVDAQLKPEEKAAILTRFTTEVKYNFVHLDSVKKEWNELAGRKFNEIVNTENDSLFLREMERLCAQLRDGHTRVWSSKSSKDRAKWTRPFPFKTKRIGDKVYVTEVYSSTLSKKGIEPGSELVEIDGKNPIAYAEEQIVPFFPSSTKQWSDYMPYSGFTLTKRPGDIISTLKFKTRKGKEVAFTGNRMDVEWDLSVAGEENLIFRKLNKNIGYLKINSFDNSAFNNDSLRSIFDRGVSQCDALIIDVRDNGGGNSSHADRLNRMLIDRPLKKPQWTSPKYVAAHASWNWAPEKYFEDGETLPPFSRADTTFHAFTKPVVVLINAGTFSSAENFVVVFKGNNRGEVVGTPSGGSSGNPIVIDLGYGYYAQICTRHEWNLDGSNFNGVGIMPDVTVEETADIFKGKDAVVETAMKILKDKIGK